MRDVKGVMGVASGSSLRIQVGAGGEAGRESVCPRDSAPPVRGDGLKVLAGWGGEGGLGGSRDGG